MSTAYGVSRFYLDANRYIRGPLCKTCADVVMLPWLLAGCVASRSTGVLDVTEPTLGPWAKAHSVVPSVVYVCDEPLSWFALRAEDAPELGASSYVWSRLYKPIQTHPWQTLYVAVQSTSSGTVNVSLCGHAPTATNETTAAGTAEIYYRCGTDVTFFPTATPSAAPSAAPSSAPTTAPTLDEGALITLYGPRSEMGCFVDTGTIYAEDVVNGSVVRRYCCGAPLCTVYYECVEPPCIIYSLGNASTVSECGCPASPGETPDPVTYNATIYGPSILDSSVCPGGFYDLMQGDVRLQRYCCGHVPDVCNATLVNLDVLNVTLHDCACPPIVDEVTPIAAATEGSQYCIVDDVVIMAYSNGGEVDGCTGQFTCPSNAGLFSNACTGHYTTAAPTDRPTFGPTPAPTYRVTVEGDTCWTFNMSESPPQCVANLSATGGTWCLRLDAESTLYKVANIAVGPAPDAAAERPATLADFDALESNNTAAANRTRVWVADYMTSAVEHLDAGTCWCHKASVTRKWFPFSAIQYVAYGSANDAPGMRSVTTPVNISRTFYPTYTDVISPTYAAMLGTVVDVGALVTITDDPGGWNASVAETPRFVTEDECTGADPSCAYYPSTHTFGTFDPQCLFVCAAVYDVPGTTSTGPPSVVMYAPGTNYSSCTAESNFMWLNQWALTAMVHSSRWQQMADVVDVAGAYDFVPWINLTRAATNYDSNCNLLGEQYCGLLGASMSTYEAWHCSEPPASMEFLEAIAYNGLGSSWAVPDEVDCEGTTPLNRVMPLLDYINVTGNTTPVAEWSDGEQKRVRLGMHGLFWRNMAAIGGNISACSGLASYDIQVNDTVVVTVGVLLERVVGYLEGCEGLPGCEGIVESAVCITTPGCVWIDATTQGSTTTTTTVGDGFNTLPPVRPNKMAARVKINKQAALGAFGVAAVLIIMLLITSAILNHTAGHSVDRLLTRIRTAVRPAPDTPEHARLLM
jgi:hypothetical protein